MCIPVWCKFLTALLNNISSGQRVCAHRMLPQPPSSSSTPAAADPSVHSQVAPLEGPPPPKFRFLKRAARTSETAHPDPNIGPTSSVHPPVEPMIVPPTFPAVSTACRFKEIYSCNAHRQLQILLQLIHRLASSLWVHLSFVHPSCIRGRLLVLPILPMSPVH